jgi:hypothetical protein
MRRVFLFGVLAVVPLVLSAACSSASLVPSGGTCFQSIDCQLGLVCIYPMGGDAGSCTSNLNSIDDVPPLPDAGMMEATPMMDSPAVMDQTAPKDNNVPETVVDETGTPETGTNDAAGD